MKKSKLGYKRYSPDVKKPYNVIPSGRITMKDVDFPVYGVDNIGYAQIMYPGGEYQFPGNQVFEIPMAQVGAQVPQPFIRPNFFTPAQIRQAKIDVAKTKKPLTAEGRINEVLGDPKGRAADFAAEMDIEGEGPIDNIRHTAAGMYTADAIANKLAPYPMGPATIPAKTLGCVGSNLAGLAHEIKAFVPSLEGDYRNIPAAARMSAEDIVNNFVGSALSLNPFMTEKEKESFITDLSNRNLLPDGYEKMQGQTLDNTYVKKQYGGDLEEFGSGGLKQWFAEKWVDVKTGKECGRSGKDKDGRPYPACRPSRRVNSTTPKTTSEMSSAEKAKFKSVKTSGQRINYNHKRAQVGGFMMPEGLSPAFFTGMKDAVVDAFKSFMASPDEPVAKPKPTDWRKLSRPEQIDYGIRQIVALEDPKNRKAVENLLQATAYMENTYGTNPKAYGRNYTSSFMSIDPIALTDMFTGRGNQGAYNAAQQRQFENFKKLNLPTDKKDFNKLLREDNPVAAMAAARYRYALSPQALPDPNNSRQLFDYWLKNYNGNGVLKYKSREEAFKDFQKAYQKAISND